MKTLSRVPATLLRTDRFLEGCEPILRGTGVMSSRLRRLPAGNQSISVWAHLCLGRVRTHLSEMRPHEAKARNHEPQAERDTIALFSWDVPIGKTQKFDPTEADGFVSWDSAKGCLGIVPVKDWTSTYMHYTECNI